MSEKEKKLDPQIIEDPAPVQNEKNDANNVSANKKGKKKKSKVNNSIFGGIITICIILTVSVFVAIKGITYCMEYFGVGKSENEISFNIPQGADNEQIADILEKNGIINNKNLFKFAIKMTKPAALYPGDITLKASMGYVAVIEKLAQQRESYETVKITIPEGTSLLKIANILEKKNVCKAEDFLFEFNKNQNFDFEKEANPSKDAYYRMEGYFLPNTYEFYVDDTAYNVTKKIREQFVQTFTDEMYAKVKKSGLSLNEVITLASIVQLESENVKQMPKVASVFINRLNNKDKFPKIQSDTTKNYIKNVIKAQEENPESIEHYTQSYDTYQRDGLPVGPICNPGIEAINAVLTPAKTDYYFFCNNLKTKKTYYAKTLKEHEKNLKAAGLAK